MKTQFVLTLVNSFFGTAGLRGEIGPGPNRMNRALVRRVTYAVGQHLMADVGATERGVVIV